LSKDAKFKKKIQCFVLFIIAIIAIYMILIRTLGIPVLNVSSSIKNISDAVVVVDVHSACYSAETTDTYLYVLYDNRILYTYRGMCKAEDHENVSNENYLQYIFKIRKQIITRDEYNYVVNCCENIENISDLSYLYKRYAAADAKCINIKYKNNIIAEPDDLEMEYYSDINTLNLAERLMEISVNYPCNFDTVKFVWKNNGGDIFELIPVNDMSF